MKHLARILSLLILVSATVFFTACDKSDGGGKSEKDQQIDKLVGTWTATSVTHNTDPQDAYTGTFKLTITRSSSELMTYSTAGRPSGVPTSWDSDGTLAFGSTITSDLIRDDGQTITYSLSGSTLTMTISGFTGSYVGRVESAEGDWVFTMTK